MSLLTAKPEFLYPHSRQFPFDEVAEKIVRALEKRNWKVPGITIEFDTYGSGEAKYQMVRFITGSNFKLHFNRKQGQLNAHWNDCAALHSVCIPKQHLEVFSDESGPSYYLYVGNDWETDKEWFMDSLKVHSKLNNEPRRYLRYDGCEYKKRPKELLANNDLDREYSPEGNDPVRINLEQKFNEITSWLEEFVLGYILNFPQADVVESPTPIPKPIPYIGLWHTIYSICDAKEAQRIKNGKENPGKLPPEQRHAFIGNARRLVPLTVNAGELPEIAFEGFIWCDVNQENKVSKNSEFVYEVQSAMASAFGGLNYIVAINLKYANDVYVADNSKYNETRNQLFDAILPRKRLTDEELDTAIAARGATIIPITEYKGDFKEPIVLIQRELEFEEIAWIKQITK